MAHQSLDLIRRTYDAFQQADIKTIRDVFSDEIVWHNGGSNLLAGDYVGLEQVVAVLLKTVSITGGNFRIDVHDMLASDDHAVALVRAFGEREGKVLDGERYVSVYHIRDGKIAEAWFHWENPDVASEFFS